MNTIQPAVLFHILIFSVYTLITYRSVIKSKTIFVTLNFCFSIFLFMFINIILKFNLYISISLVYLIDAYVAYHSLKK
jgi:hypothetical protein